MSEPVMERFDELLTTWIEELGRAIEMFTGEKPVLTLSRPSGEVSGADVAEHTWWKQVVQSGKSFSIWTGVTESIWKALGEGDDAQSTLFEILGQANQGTAAVLSAGFTFPLRCLDGSMEAPVLPLKTAVAHIAVNFRGADAGRIMLLLEKSAFAILSAEDEAAAGSNADKAVGPAGASALMLSRLLDLQLPVSVVLGRASITIKEALKLMPGSVIELDRQVGDWVEIIVQGVVVAKGEIVSVKGNYGVRIKEVISRQDRIALHDAA